MWGRTTTRSPAVRPPPWGRNPATPHSPATSQPVPQFHFPSIQSLASARVVLTGEPYVSNNPATDPLYESSVRDRGLRSVLTVPVRHNGRILGLLYALNKPGGFLRE